MRSLIALGLQSTVKQQASQVAGTQAGTIQAVLLYGDTPTSMKTARAFAEKQKIKESWRKPIYDRRSIHVLYAQFILQSNNSFKQGGLSSCFLYKTNILSLIICAFLKIFNKIEKNLKKYSIFIFIML